MIWNCFNSKNDKIDNCFKIAVLICDLYLNFRITKWTLYHWIRESENNNNGIMLLQLITQVAKGRLYCIGTVSNRHIRINMLSTTILKTSCKFIVSYSNELVLKLVSGHFFYKYYLWLLVGISLAIKKSVWILLIIYNTNDCLWFRTQYYKYLNIILKDG